MRVFLSVILLFLPLASSASDVRQMPYSYAHNVVEDAGRDVFVICDNCPERQKLQLASPKVPLAIRVSETSVAPFVTKPEEKKEEEKGEKLTEAKQRELASHKNYTMEQMWSLYPDDPQSPQKKAAQNPSEQDIASGELPPASMSTYVVQKNSELNVSSDAGKAGEGVNKNSESEEEVQSFLIPAIHFGKNDYRVTQKEKRKLMHAIAKLKKSNATIKVAGYTCNLGSKKYNDSVALKRAEAVADILKKNGITVTEVVGKGKCCYISEDGALNRRVEIAVS